MNDFNREMAMLMAGTGSMAIHGKTIGNVSPYIEWIKWLSYTPDFQKKKIIFDRNEEEIFTNIKSV